VAGGEDFFEKKFEKKPAAIAARRDISYRRFFEEEL